LFNLLDLGLAGAITRNAGYAMGGVERLRAHGLPRIVRPDSAPNWSLIRAISAGAVLYYRKVLWIAGVAALLPGSLYFAWLVAKSDLPLGMVATWWLMACAGILGLYLSRWSSLLLGIGEVRVQAQIALAAQVSGLAATVILLLCGAGIWTFGVAGVVSGSVLGLWCRTVFRARTPEGGVPPEAAVGALHALWPMAIRQGFVTIGSFLITRSSLLIVSTILGLKVSASFGISLALVGVISAVVSVPLSVVTPWIHQQRAVGNIGALRRRFLGRVYFGMTIGLIGSLALVLAGQPILPQPVLAALCLVALLEAHHSMFAQVVLTENENPFVAPALISGVFIVVLGIAGAHTFGIWGVVAAQGLVQLAFNNWWPVVRAFRGLRASGSDATGMMGEA
jgi:O-antigen/teichoic acid export membrane protein